MYCSGTQSVYVGGIRIEFSSVKKSESSQNPLMKDIFRYPAIAFLFALCLSSFPANAIGRGSSTYIKSASYIQLSEAVLQPSAEFAEVEEEQAYGISEKTPVLAVRSNLLVPALNIGAELPLGNHWSISADYYYPWLWPSKKNKNCFELLGWSAEGRYWFGRNRTKSDRLHGHSLGLYGAGGYYDFERNFKGQQGEFVSAGLDYTYAMPVGKKKRVNLEFTLALGYIRSYGRAYHVLEEYGPLFKEEGDIIFDFFGPTRIAVNLVVPFYRKEGRR